jgi:hypothetical protein
MDPYAPISRETREDRVLVVPTQPCSRGQRARPHFRAWDETTPIHAGERSPSHWVTGDRAIRLVPQSLGNSSKAGSNIVPYILTGGGMYPGTRHITLVGLLSRFICRTIWAWEIGIRSDTGRAEV